MNCRPLDIIERLKVMLGRTEHDVVVMEAIAEIVRLRKYEVDGVALERAIADTEDAMKNWKKRHR